MIKKFLFIIFVMLLLIDMSQEKNIQKVSTYDSPVMYLTFDDGPNEYTLQILDILDEYNIKATFFVTGTRSDYFYLIKEANNRGHTIGLHAYSHDYDVIYQDIESYLNDLEKISGVVEEQIGKKSYYLRFPGGSSNTVSKVDMYDLISAVEELGYRYFDWNGEIGDSKGGSTLGSVISTGMFGVTGKKDVMMLCHDKSVTVEALPTLIEYYQDLGYVFLPISANTNGFCHLK